MSENQDMMKDLRTKRLVLRQFCSSDAQRLHYLANDKQVANGAHYMPYPFLASAAEEWLVKHKELVREGRAAVFAICQRSPTESNESPELIGTVGLAIVEVDQRAEIGYWLGREYWGNGFCTEAVVAVVEYGFEDLGLHRIFAHHISRNVASARVLEKAGFSKEGVFRQHARKWGVFEDTVCYGMLCSDPRPS